MKHLASPSHIAVPACNPHAEMRLPPVRVVNFVNFVKPADTFRTQIGKVDAALFRDYLTIKPVLGVRRDLYNNRATNLNIFRPVVFLIPAVISGQRPNTRKFLCI